MKNDIYICLTYHHVLISCLKASQSSNSDILLLSNIIDGENLQKRLRKTKIFKNVYRIDEKYIFKSTNKINYYFWKLYNKRYVEKESGIKKLIKHKNIYLFHDWNWVSLYLKSTHRKYHLLEDGIDYYKTLKEETINHVFRNFSKKETIKYLIFPFCRDNIKFHDRSKQVVDIEVNDKNGTILKNENKIKEHPRKVLFDSLIHNKYFNEILYVFANDIIIKGNNNLIIFGSCLSVDGKLPYEYSISKYKLLIDKCSNKYKVYFKAHPRDLYHYSFENACCLNPTFPSEILKYVYDSKVKKYIAISSTSCNIFEKSKTIIFDSFDEITDDVNI